jgi:hypothetical protein
VVAEYRVSVDPLAADPQSERILFGGWPTERRCSSIRDGRQG